MEATCNTCQTRNDQAAGRPVSQARLVAADLWGCTCEPETKAEAVDFMDRVTR